MHSLNYADNAIKDFLNRERELGLLSKTYGSNRFKLIVILGRRRIGKTQLITRSLKDRRTIECTGLRSTEEDNLRNMVHSFFSAVFPCVPAPAFNSYREFFKFMNHSEAFLNGHYVIAFDEHPYLAGSDDSLSSVLQYSIDHYWINTDIKLILCGSSIGFMRDKVLSGSSPLFGRTTLRLELRPFELWEMKAYGWGYSAEDTALLYSCLGGIPKYVNMVDPGKSPYMNLYDLFFSPNAILSGEADSFLNEEFDQTARYSAILSAIASGKSSLNDISQSIGIQSGTLNYYTSSMEIVGILKKELPFDARNSRKTVYTISDGLLRFHYLSIMPNANMINFGHGRDVMDTIVIPSLSRYMGLEWERISTRYMLASYDRSSAPFMYSNISRWWGGSIRKHSQIEIDMISTYGEKALFGECKWTNDKVGISVLNELKEKAEQFSYAEKYWYLFSKSGFDEALLDISGKDKSLRLIDLDEVYSFEMNP